MQPLSKITRFRAYQLGNEGSSFSYFDGSSFFLIEGRLTDLNERAIDHELSICNINHIDTLHVTSWDEDHCEHGELERLLDKYKPSRIEIPGYAPKTDCGEKSQMKVWAYQNANAISRSPKTIDVATVNPQYLSTLVTGKPFTYQNILFHPRAISGVSNDDSTIKLFRSGSFSVLSLGDVESPDISRIIQNDSLAQEVDVLILAHHGADNGFTTDEFIKKLKPRVAICTANFANQYDHPRQEIRDILYQNGVNLYTTKTGDCVIKSIGTHTGQYQVVNLQADSTEISSTVEFRSKRVNIPD